MKKFVLLIVFALVPFVVYAGGYAGNGGGLVEQNFNFAYSSLPRLIDSSLFTFSQQLTEKEIGTLNNIKKIALDNISNSKRLVFLSGQEHPEIFTTGPNELHRLAVTSNRPGDVIYVNGDFLYSETGAPLLTTGEIISILTHEIGHQSNEADHQYLDILGTKIRNYYMQNVKSYEIEKNGVLLSFSSLNQKSSYNTAQLFYQNDSRIINLTGFIQEKINSKLSGKPFLFLTGFTLINGNYKMELLPQRYVFQVWVSANFSNPDGSDDLATNELFSVEFEITADNSVVLAASPN
jgi:hypothetical protein